VLSAHATGHYIEDWPRDGELLRAVAASASQAGIAQISLSVERKNLARELYLSEGYQVVSAGYAGSDTMVKDLAAGPAAG
jgi:opacity protein-like surface antigen